MPLPLMVIAELLGAPIEDWPRLRVWSDAIMGLANTVAPGPDTERAVARFRATRDEMRDYLAPLLAHLPASPDIWDILIVVGKVLGFARVSAAIFASGVIFLKRASA